MTGIIIVTHANFADGLKNACEMVAGPQDAFEAVCFDGQTQIEELAQSIAAKKENMDGVIIVTDLINATPYNASLMVIAYSDDVVMTGASLPLVLELLIARNTFEGSAKELADSVADQKGPYVSVTCSSDVFK